jgi:hypothetical protein
MLHTGLSDFGQKNSDSAGASGCKKRISNILGGIGVGKAARGPSAETPGVPLAISAFESADPSPSLARVRARGLWP